MSSLSLRKRPRISYYEPEEPNLDEYIFCSECGDFVYEYCSIHGPLLVIPDDKVPSKSPYPPCVPRSALTIPHVFLHLAPSIIPGAGIGVFSTLTLPCGVRFGPYKGKKADDVSSLYSWQIHDGNNRRSHYVDAEDTNGSNWMRYVNCSRHWNEQNLVAYQYKGKIYYRTIKIIFKFTELMVFYGGEFANILQISLKKYNSTLGYIRKFGGSSKEITKENNNLATNEKSKINETEKIDSTRDTPAITLNDKPKEFYKKRSAKEHNVAPKRHSSLKEKNVAPNGETIIKNNNKNRKPKKNKLNSDLEKCKVNDRPKTENSSTITNKKSYPKKEFIEEKFNNKILPATPVENANNDIPTTHKTLITSSNKFICNICRYETFCKTYLIVHLRLHNRDEGDIYSCNDCKYITNNKGNLMMHKRIHTGEKPYQCPMCPKKFIQNSHLFIHKRIHTGEKPYQCPMCPKNFITNSHLIIHKRIHTGEKPYQCPICPKKFIQNSDLIIHKRIHTGEKPYQCPICPKKFIQNSDLIIHKRIHTGEKPYQCKTCLKKFTRSSNLNTHMNVHEKKL